MFGLFGGGKKKDAGNIRRDLIESASHFLIESLQVQIGHMHEASLELPAAAMDDFSLGYVAGYTESLSQMREIENESNHFIMHQVVFTELFGPRQGPVLFARFLKAQSDGSDEIIMGMKIGGEDLFAWLNGDKEAPDQWASYVNRN